MTDLKKIFSPKQMEFILNSTGKWNFAHGSVRSGKTVCTLFRLMECIIKCPDSKIYIVGKTFDTAYRNVVELLLYGEELSMFRPMLTWSGKKLYVGDKTVTVLGAKDEGAVGVFQGLSASLIYCDEMTLYPRNVIEMIDSRLSYPHSMGFAAMNPQQPDHIVKKWIDLAEKDKSYYALHFRVEDNPFLPEDYVRRLRENSTGIFRKRNYYGEWCLAEGAIFDFFERSIYVIKDRDQPPAEYWIAGVDVGTSNAFACLLIGVSTGIRTQTGKKLWVQDEYYWDSKAKGKQKTLSEYAEEVAEFLEPYSLKGIYVDPSAAAFKVEMQRRGYHVIDADNDVENGIQHMTSEMRKGNLFVHERCVNTIREIEGYVWDPACEKKGYDAPLKKDDHAVDALRYALYTHKVSTYDPYKESQSQKDYMQNRFGNNFKSRF